MNRDCCHSCEEYVEMEEGETTCKKCEARIAKEIAYYEPLYEGAKLAGFIDSPVRALNDKPISGDRF